MKYNEIDTKDAKKCCKQHVMYKIKGKPIFNCDKCPLRRTNHTGKTSFCWFRLNNFYEECEEEHKELQIEDVNHEEEWQEWVKNNLLESEE